MTTDYELWSFGQARYDPGPGWVFHGYARLNLLQVLQYENYGYCVRKVIGDRSSTIPLFRVQFRIIRRCILSEGCWLWQGGVNNLGYGLVKWLGSRFLIHRIIWAVYNDQEIPYGYTIDHLCRVRNCVRPSHLEAVTHQENCRRRNDRRSS